MSEESGLFFVGPGDKRALLLGADGKTFLQVAADGAITLLNSAAFTTLPLASPVLTTPTLLAPAFSSSPTGEGVTQYADVAITKANILAMNGAPVTVVAGVTGQVVEFCGAVLIFKYAGNTYGGGGDITLQSGAAGATLSNTIAKANGFGAGGDKIYTLAPVNAAGGIALGNNSGITITNATGAFTDPGGPAATGTARLLISFRRWTSGV